MKNKQKSREEYKPPRWQIKEILLRNFDNDKYNWVGGDKEINDFIDQALTQHTEDIIKKLEKMSYQEDNLYGDLPGNEVVNLDQAIETIK